jgi:hypothetical protein
MVPRGQAIVAAMIVKTFQHILTEKPEPFQLPSELLFVPEVYYKRMEEGALFQVNFNDLFTVGPPPNRDTPSYGGIVSMTEEWMLTDEGRRNKWGLVSTTPGSYVTVLIPENAHSLYLTVLKSYENMGVAEISLENCTQDYHLIPQKLDCLWEPRASQNYVFSMDFNPNNCTVLKITVEPTDRQVNKIKLISLSFT